MYVRRRLFILALCLDAIAPVHAGAGCAVVDLMPAFWQSLQGTDPATQMRTAVIDPHPDLYNDNYVSLSSGAEWQKELEGEKTYVEGHRAEVNAVEHYLVGHVQRPCVRKSSMTRERARSWRLGQRRCLTTAAA